MPDTKQHIQSALSAFSFLSDVHVVGGAVRDAIIGRKSDDIDLATSDTPEEVMRKCRDRGWDVVETGVQHGTVTALFDPDVIRGPGEFEITTFRKDVSTDGRNATVEWAQDIEEDLRRRDFTVNAMAARQLGNSGFEIVDPFGGRDDIKRGRIAAVGDPRRRFREDFLRIVRAARFASRFEFWIGEEEQKAMRELAPQVAETVSTERVVTELVKAFKDDNPIGFLTEIHGLGILEDVLDAEIGEMGPVFCSTLVDHWRHRMIQFLRGLEQETDLTFGDLKTQLRLPNDLARDARQVAEALDRLVEVGMAPKDHERRELFAEFGLRLMRGPVRAIGEAMGADPEVFEEPDAPVDPVVTGGDFIRRGHEEGPVIGELVEAAHERQLRDAEADTDTLIQHAESKI